MKYELLKDDTTTGPFGQTLYRIRALVAFGAIAAGALGGYVESEKNLSQVSGDAWVSGNAWVSGDARVSGNAWVSPLVIHGLTWTVTMTDTQMTIGCQSHELERWATFDDRVIAKMDSGALAFWTAHKAQLLGLAEATGRPFVMVEDPAS